MPEFIYEAHNIIYPDEQHPPIPWPHQIRRAAQAMKEGNKYLFCIWYRHNLYQIFSDRYYQLKYLIKQSDHAEEIINAIITDQVESMYINHPYNPKSIFLFKKDGSYLRIGEGLDKTFENGIEAFLSERKS